MDSSYYVHEIIMKKHLNRDTYGTVDGNAGKKVYSKLKKLIDKLKSYFTEK